MARNLQELPIRQLAWDSADSTWEESEVVMRSFLDEDVSKIAFPMCYSKIQANTTKMLDGEPEMKGDVRILFFPRVEDFEGADAVSKKFSETLHIDPSFWMMCETELYFQGNAFPFTTQHQASEDWTCTHMSRFTIQDREEENMGDGYHQHSLAFYSVWLSEANRASFTQFLLCFGLSDMMKYSVVKDFKESDGLVMSGGAFEDQPIVNESLPEDPQHRCRLLLDKYEKMSGLSKKVIQAREFLTATEETFYSINKYAENFNERWSSDAQMGMKQRIKVLKQFGKATHKIGKRAGSCKRRLDHESKLIHQLISAEKAAESRQRVAQSALFEESMRLRQYMFVLFCIGMIALVFVGIVLQSQFKQRKSS
ncbi:uncharacterized protein BHQ10_006022 [Talaromyces amestolkiae]|uniref:Uncharacterized protein n=1 Tax=Talaromyces amestolkiae TaxID=1196081 RepID=A0A364L2J3_TALAM|nr:uncharacterized protein BHQ10_006022 [Talaromyces amestolkiae]RAO70010.1 hypothetical protein BHQ10_006022 [Talaromyces amestolkiae]